MKTQPLSLLLLHQAIAADARSDELDTLKQAEQIAAAISQLGWQLQMLSTNLNLENTAAQIKKQQPDCVFNLVESLAGQGKLIHSIPALLSQLAIPYTGVSADAMYLSSHKRLAKKVMQYHHIDSAESFDLHGPLPASKGPWIVKSLWEHASFGMDDGCVVNNSAEALQRIRDSQQRLGGEWFAERYLSGREFNVSVLELNGQPQVLPIAEMCFIDYPQGKPKIVSYAAKWDEDSADYHATQRHFPTLNPALSAAIHRQVLQCWQAFGLSGYARVDIRCDEHEQPWVLEVNANPCLTMDAGFAAAAAQAGISYQQVIKHIVLAALANSAAPAASVAVAS